MNPKLPDGWFDDADIATYRMFYEGIPDYCGAVELGVFKGRSICSVADIIKRKHLTVFAVDTFAGTIGEPDTIDVDMLRIFKDNLKAFGIEQNVIIMSTDTITAAQSLATSIVKKVDLVFLDADHSFETVSNDIRAWLPRVIKGGIIAGHDYNRPSVRSAVHDVLGVVESEGGIWFKRL